MNLLLGESSESTSNQKACACQVNQSDTSLQTDQSNDCSVDSDNQSCCKSNANQSNCCRSNQSNSKKVVVGMEKLSVFDKKAKPVIDF